MFPVWKNKLNNQNGFTLVELMVVIAILGILAAIAIPQFTGSINAAKNAKLEADLRTIDGALMIYYADKREFPDSTGKLNDYINAWPDDAAGIPLDYVRDSNGQAYTLTGKKHDNTVLSSPGSKKPAIRN